MQKIITPDNSDFINSVINTIYKDIKVVSEQMKKNLKYWRLGLTDDEECFIKQTNQFSEHNFISNGVPCTFFRNNETEETDKNMSIVKKFLN